MNPPSTISRSPSTVLRWFTINTLLISAVCVAVRAEDEPQELSDARQTYKKEVEFATRAIRDRYLTKLDVLKRTLGSKGDARGALIVDQEIEQVKASILDSMGAEKFAGTWYIKYESGSVRRYTINADGYVTYNELDGKPFPLAKGRILFRNSQFLLEFGDGFVERFSLHGALLNSEIFKGRDPSSAGASVHQGIGSKEARRR